MIIRSRGKYLDVFLPGHPMADKRGRVLLHRYVLSKHIGRLLTDGEIVHHKDHNPRNNDPSNLELTNPSAHARMHAKLPKMANVACAWCGTMVARPARVLRHRRGLPFCCISHGALYQQKQQRGGLNEIQHGLYGRYLKGCRCAECRAANNDRMKIARSRAKLRRLG